MVKASENSGIVLVPTRVRLNASSHNSNLDIAGFAGVKDHERTTGVTLARTLPGGAVPCTEEHVRKEVGQVVSDSALDKATYILVSLVAVAGKNMTCGLHRGSVH